MIGWTILVAIGQVIFLSIGLTFGIADWDLKEILEIGVGVFGFIILVSILLILFGATRYWSFDDKGISNGNIFIKKTFLYEEIDSFEEKYVAIGAKPFVAIQKNWCFYKDKRCVTIPCEHLKNSELEWIKSRLRID